jgi:hypothetical protein
MNSDNRGKQSESAGWKPMPRTIDLSAEEIASKEGPDASPESVGQSGQQPAGADSVPREAEDGAQAGGKADADTDERIAAGDPDPFAVDAAAGSAEAKASEASPHPTSREPRKRRWRLLAAAAVVLFLGGAGATYFLTLQEWLPTFADNAASSRLAEVEAQIAAIEGRLATIGEVRAERDRLAGRAAELEQRLAKLETDRLGQPPVPFDGEAWESLVARLNDAESAIFELEKKASPSPTITDGESLGELTAKVDEAASQAEALRSQIGELQGRLESLAAKFEAGLGEARGRLAESERAAREAAARSLRTAYERGEALQPWLDAIEGHVGANADLEALRNVGSVPTTAALQDGLADIHGQILDAGAPAEDGIVGGLLQNAKRLVRVRPDGPVQGLSPEAILSRVEAALREERLADADAEWQQLPPQARQAGSQWHERLAARIAADAGLSGVLRRLAETNLGPQDPS